MMRYTRQIQLPEVGRIGQQKLLHGRVLVVGAGGLGSALLPLLVGAGVGVIRLYDGDVVALSNLHRQTLYDVDDLGRGKAECAQLHLNALNPQVKIDAHCTHLSQREFPRACAGVDVVIDAADNFALTYALSDYCAEHQLPLISASVLGFKGYVGTFCGTGPSYRALFPRLPASGANCQTAGVMGPVVHQLGALQAQMALSLLLQHSPSPQAKLITLDCQHWQMESIDFSQACEPEQRIPFIESFQITPEDVLIECRPEEEAPQLLRKDAQRIHPKEILHAPLPTDRRIVLICQSGIRAAQAAYRLQANGRQNLAIHAAGQSNQQGVR